MIRAATAAFVTLALFSQAAPAQDAATRKAARAIHQQEKEVLHRVTQRIEYDKKLDGSTVKVEVQPGGAVTLSGSVMNESAKNWAVDLVTNTTGVTSVVDQLAVVKNVKVYESKTPAVVEVARPIYVPSESKVIAKP